MRFYNFKLRQTVWSQRGELANSGLIMSENFSGDTEYTRKKIYPIYRAARNMPQYNKKVSMVEDTLILNNKRFTVNNLDDLPEELLPKNHCYRSDDNTLVFGGTLSEYCGFSNWSKSDINYNNQAYTLLEQGYMHIKATESGDTAAACKILCSTDPREIKKIGSEVNMKDIKKWDAMREGVMLNLVRAKFTQNEHLKQELLATGDKKLGESGRDRVYSVGLPLTHPRILDVGSWTAPSKLGTALETVRTELRNT